MGYALFSEAKEWLREAAATDDDYTLGRLVNNIRQLLYNQYDKLPLFRDVTQCFDLQRYHEPGLNGHQYAGITLPRGMQTPEAMWVQRRPIEMQGAWRLWHPLMTGECACGLTAIDMGQWPTERDIIEARPCRAQVRCALPGDAGKTFVLGGIGMTGEKVEQQFALSTTYQQTDLPLISIDKGGVRKAATEGPVILADESGRALSIYAPDETVPGYTRLRIAGLPNDCLQINVRAARRFLPLCADFDVVESDNRLGFEELARYFRLNTKVTKDSSDIGALKMHLSQGLNYFMGEKAREIGKGTLTQMQVAAPGFGFNHQLRGRRRLLR